ncbi:MAG: hypothetical protein ABSB15_19945 [Bryobacteraceae bacterium]
MKLTVRSIKHVLQQDVDIDPTAQVDVRTIDALIFSCNAAAQDALTSVLPSGFNAFERDHLKSLIDCQRHGHLTIRRLLQGEQSASAVDALPIARLQLEVLYSLCFMLQGAQNVRSFLKNGWKRKYVRFLLEREERRHLPRFAGYLTKTAQPWIDQLQVLSSVTEDERRTIEQEQLGSSPGPPFNQKQMLMRLYPEYQFLCSFAHGDSEAVFFRAVSDPRSPIRNVLPNVQIGDFYQREVLETPIFYSAIATVQAATEVAAIYPAQIELLAALTKAWATLTRFSLLAVPVWEIRAKSILPLI